MKLRPMTKADRSLPPSINGQVKGFLSVEVSRVLWTIRCSPDETIARIKWWGEADAGVCLRPPRDGHFVQAEEEALASKTVARYAIRCGPEQLTAYLRDAGHLDVEVVSGKVVQGSVTVANLVQLNDGKPINGYFPIMKPNGGKIGHLHVRIATRDLKGSHFRSPASIASKAENLLDIPIPASLPVRHKKNTPMPFKRFNNNLLKSNHNSTKSQPTVHKKSIRRDASGKIAAPFLGEVQHLAESKSQQTRMQTTTFRGTSYQEQASALPNTLSDKWELPFDDAFEFLENNKDVEIDLERTAIQTILGNDLSPTDFRTAKTLSGFSSSESEDDSFCSDLDPGRDASILHSLFYQQLPKEAGIGVMKQPDNLSVPTERKVSFTTPAETLPKSSGSLPKLDLERAALLKKVRFVRVLVDKLILAAKVDTLEDAQKLIKDKVIRDEKVSICALEYQFPRKSTKGTAMAATETVRITPKKIADNVVVFNHRSVFPVTFGGSTLKQWRQSAIQFRVFTKDGSQKALLGSALLSFQSVLESAGLSVTAHLALKPAVKPQSRSCDQPPEGSHRLKVKVELASDVRGFYSSLASLRNRTPPASVSPATTVKSPSPSKSSAAQPRMEESVHSPAPKTPSLSEKTTKSTPRSSVVHTQVAAEIDTPVTLHAFLSISQGVSFIAPMFHQRRRFRKRRKKETGKLQRRITRNLYFECRIFDRNDVARSPVCWSTLNPTFNYKLVTPFFLSEAFLERVWNNYSVIEVWDKLPPMKDQLVGICKLPLHQFYLSFCKNALAKSVLDCELPVIAVDGFLQVTDVVTHREMGQLRVTLALGSPKQDVPALRPVIRDVIGNLTAREHSCWIADDLTYALRNACQENATKIQNFRNQIKVQSENTSIPKNPVFESVFGQNRSESEAESTSTNEHEEIEVAPGEVTWDSDAVKDINAVNTTTCELEESGVAYSAGTVSHTFTIAVEGIQGLQLPSDLIWGEADCFVTFEFPTGLNNGLLRIQSCQTKAVIATPVVVFKDTRQLHFNTTGDQEQYVAMMLQKVCPTGVVFSVWCRRYSPSTVQSIIATATFPLARLCALITLWNQGDDPKLSSSLPLMATHRQNQRVESAGLLDVSIMYASKRAKPSRVSIPMSPVSTTNRPAVRDSDSIEEHAQTTSENGSEPTSAPQFHVKGTSPKRPATGTASPMWRVTVPGTPREALQQNEELEEESIPIEVGEKSFQAQLHIEEAKRLSGACSKENSMILPNAYVTMRPSDVSEIVVTPMVESSNSPQWNWQQCIVLPVSYITDSQKLLVLKVWHKETHLSGQDQLLGLVYVDLATLGLGMQQVSGWYHVVTYDKQCRGELKVSVTPLEDLSPFIRKPLHPTTFKVPSDNVKTNQEVDDLSRSLLINHLRRSLEELEAFTSQIAAASMETTAKSQSYKTTNKLGALNHADSQDKNKSNISGLVVGKVQCESLFRGGLVTRSQSMPDLYTHAGSSSLENESSTWDTHPKSRMCSSSSCTDIFRSASWDSHSCCKHAFCDREDPACAIENDARFGSGSRERDDGRREECMQERCYSEFGGCEQFNGYCSTSHQATSPDVISGGAGTSPTSKGTNFLYSNSSLTYSMADPPIPDTAQRDLEDCSWWEVQPNVLNSHSLLRYLDSCDRDKRLINSVQQQNATELCTKSVDVRERTCSAVTSQQISKLYDQASVRGHSVSIFNPDIEHRCTNTAEVRRCGQEDPQQLVSKRVRFFINANAAQEDELHMAQVGDGRGENMTACQQQFKLADVAVQRGNENVVKSSRSDTNSLHYQVQQHRNKTFRRSSRIAANIYHAEIT